MAVLGFQSITHFIRHVFWRTGFAQTSILPYACVHIFQNPSLHVIVLATVCSTSALALCAWSYFAVPWSTLLPAHQPMLHAVSVSGCPEGQVLVGTTCKNACPSGQEYDAFGFCSECRLECLTCCTIGNTVSLTRTATCDVRCAATELSPSTELSSTVCISATQCLAKLVLDCAQLQLQWRYAHIISAYVLTHINCDLLTMQTFPGFT